MTQYKITIDKEELHQLFNQDQGMVDCKFNCPPYSTSHTKLPDKYHWLFCNQTSFLDNCSSIAQFA